MPRIPYGISIKRLFFLYMLAFLVFILFGGIVALSLSDGLQSVSDTVVTLNKEKDHLAQNVRKKFSEASAQAVSLSRTLSASLERRLEEHNLSIRDLSGKPDVLTEILGGEINRLLLSLEKTKCSGVFVVLDATVNSGIENAEYSRAGLYIRNIDQGFMNKTADLLFLRGPTQIAITEGFTLQTRWALEFDVRDQPFWKQQIEARDKNLSLPLSRLYYWYLTDSFSGLYENTAVCSVPLLDAKGRFLGVCGFETGTRKFARDNPLNISNNLNVAALFFMFCTQDRKRFLPREALFTGDAIQTREMSRRRELVIGGNLRGLEIFRHEGSDAYVGLWRDIAIYPGDSFFADDRFAVAITMPRKDFDSIVFASRMRLIFVVVILLFAGVALSLFMSDRYEKPFKKLTYALRSGNMSAKSNIQEIDDLLEFMLVQLDEARTTENKPQETSDSDLHKHSEKSMEDMLEDFIANTKKLSRAEADVFNLYLEGHTAEKIADILCLSINTIKTHNRRIFAKLNVSSRKELLTWIQVLTVSGRTFNDSHQRQLEKIRNAVKYLKDT